MVIISRKRKRSTTDLDLDLDSSSSPASINNKSNDDPPFTPAHLSLYRNHRKPLSRTLTTGTSPLIINLLIIAGHRLQQRDYKSASTVIPTLLKRYHKLINNSWSCSREITITSAHILKYSNNVITTNNNNLLDEFLSHIAQDKGIANINISTGITSSDHTRESALFERILDLLSEGKLKFAFDALYAHSQEDTFQDCALIQGYLGILALALSNGKDLNSSSFLGRIAVNSLSSAANLQPQAYMYRYYAAAVEMAAGYPNHAVDILRKSLTTTSSTSIVSQNHSYRVIKDDPISLYGLLSCLNFISSTNHNTNNTNHSHNDHQNKQERVNISRRLLKIDPYCKQAIDILREAHSWSWSIHPPVDDLELCTVYACRIENGNVADLDTWLNLGTHLAVSQNIRKLFWVQQSRNDWWPSHFFRPSRVSSDIRSNSQLAAVKAAISKMLTHPDICPYTNVVISSGAVEIFPFEVKT